MKKRITSLLLAAAMTSALTLTSCTTQNKPQPEMSRVTHVYKSTDITLPEEYNVGDMYAVGDRILLKCTEVLNKETYERREFMLDLDVNTGEYTEVELPTFNNETEQMYGLCPTEDGAFIMAVAYIDNMEQQLYHFELQRLKDGETAVLCDNLEPLFETDLSESRHGSDFYVQKIVVDGDGNIYIVTETLIGVFDKDMKKLFELSFDFYIDDVGVSADGRVYVNYRDGQTWDTMVKYIDVSARALGADVPMPDTDINNVSVYIGPGYDVYYNNGSSVYGCNDGGEPVELLNWINSDIMSSGIRDLIVLDADKFLANYYEYDENGAIRELYILEQVPDEEVPERYVIDLAVGYDSGSGEIVNSVVKFNRASDEYRVRITSYDKYNTEDNYSGAEDKLVEEFTAGTAPDIVMLSEFSNRGTLIEKNLFLDLYTLMEVDESFDKSQLFDCVLGPMERGGKLYELVTVMSLSTIAAKRANAPYDTWTVDEFLDWAESLPEDKYLFDYSGQMQMLNTLLALSLDEFIDTEKGTVDFDDPTFRRMLEYAKNTESFNYTGTLSGDDLADYENDRNRVYREDKMLLSEVYMSQVSDLLSAMFTYGFENVTFVGYPTSDGNGAVLQPSTSYAINKDSLVAEGAWEFIKSTFNVSSRYGSYGFSSLRERFRTGLEDDMNMHYFFRYSGGMSGSSSDAGYAERTDGIARDITEADAALLEELINGASAVPSYAQDITELIMEDLEMYFAGDKTLDETVAIIQSIVGVYIAENS